jgi:O-succinylbenzoic acid--CoA ligase
VGQPLYGTRVQILSHEGEHSADGEPLAPGERGEIVVSGPTVTSGYLDEERTAAAFGPHGLHTGDVGYRDADGRLWIEGRIDDVIVTGGELVAPAEVTEQIRTVEGVADVAVLGLADEEWGERVSALVAPAADAPTDEALRTAIDEHLRETLADYKRPKTIAFAGSLPRTQSGTVDREAARERLRARRSRSDTT